MGKGSLHSGRRLPYFSEFFLCCGIGSGGQPCRKQEEEESYVSHSWVGFG
jgi:hypothetical protein